MSEENLAEGEEVETPINAAEMLARLISDLVLNESPDVLAGEFIDGFVLQEQPETSQILAMFEMPTQNLVELVKAAIEQSYKAQIDAVDNHGIQYLDGLKAAVRAEMTELAEQ